MVSQFLYKACRNFRNTSKGILNICKISEEMKIKKLFVFSSSEVYHESKVQQMKKFILKFRILIIQGILTQVVNFSEIVTLNYANESKLKFVNIIRPHNVYGPNMGYGHVVPQLYSKIKNLKTIKKLVLKFMAL